MALSIWAFTLLILSVFASTVHAESEERTDVYLSLYAIGSWPYNRDAFFQTGPAPNTSVGNGAGAGLKVAVFPAIGKGFLGIELESFGNSSNITVPLTTGPGAGTTGRTNLWVFNSMANLILRYPGKPVIPYIGIGGGLSQGVLSGANIPGRPDQDFESSATFGYQFLAGVQTDVWKRIFLFGEYKYLSANYHWQRLSLDYRSQYGLVGIGLRF
ncbi:MAG: outer membrane beta-barrel protein [Nitrospira sp. CR1.3]|nr:outer membrane beta-barrel protein [Nitrospira sp. CR1.3]